MKKNNDKEPAYLDFDSLFESESIKAYLDGFFGNEPMGETKKEAKESSKILCLLSLAWEDAGYNGLGRRMFRMGGYYLFEHQGEIGILTNENKYEYCHMTGDEIEKYTRMVRKIIEIDNHDDCYTLYDYRLAKEELKNYTERLIERDERTQDN